MENSNPSSPTEQRQDQDSTAAGPSGTHDGDDTVQGDNFSYPSEFKNENSQLGLDLNISTDSMADPSSIISRERASELGPSTGFAEGRQTDGDGPSILSPELSESEVGVSRGLSVGGQTDGTVLSSPELAENSRLSSILVPGVEAQQANPQSSFSGFHDFLFDPNPLPQPHGYRNVRQRGLVTQSPLDPQTSRPRSPASQFVHLRQQYGSFLSLGSSPTPTSSPGPAPSSDSWPSSFSDWQEGSTSSNTHIGPSTVVRYVPADSSSDDQSPSIDSASRAAPNISSPPPTIQPYGLQDIPEAPVFRGLQYHPSGWYYNTLLGTQLGRSMPPHGGQNPLGYHGMPPGMPAHMRGFPSHDQAHDNRPMAPPVVRAGRPQPRRGGRTASISQLLRRGGQNPSGGRPRGRWRAPRQTVAVPRPPTEPEPEPHLDPSRNKVVKPLGSKCFLCERDVTWPVPGGDDQPGVLPATTLLPCGHLFHAECLIRVTPESSSKDPPTCFTCHWAHADDET